MKTIQEATIEELIEDLTHWEDPDTILLISQNRDGDFWVTNYNNVREATGDTLKEAIVAFGKSYAWLTSDYTYENFEEDLNIDWRT